jgi:uncharacterized protein
MAISQDAQPREQNGSAQRAFAAQWRWTLLLGPAVFVFYRLTLPWSISLLGPAVTLHYTIVAAYGPSAPLLLALFAAHRYWWFRDLRFLGDFRSKHLIEGISAITGIYLISYGAALLLGQPREATMVTLYDHKTSAQIAIMVACLLLLPPIVEELAFRHFLLSLFPFKADVRVRGLAVLSTAAYFSYQHYTSYRYPTTFLALFALGVVFALARIRSDGLLMPITLHTYAIAFALLCDQVVSRI